MTQRYSLQEIGTYTLELRTIETQCQGWAPDTETGKQYRAIAHVMREVLLRMHESLEEEGPLRPSFFSRWVAARETRKLADKVLAKYDASEQHYLGGRSTLLPPLTPDQLKASGLSLQDQADALALGSLKPIRKLARESQHPDKCQYVGCHQPRRKLENFCMHHREAK